MPGALKASTIRIHAATLANPGTLGCVLQGTPPGGVLTRYFLTCAHVAAAPGPSTPGAELQTTDGAKIGTIVTGTNPLVDGIDAAVAELAINVDPALGGLGMPRGWTQFIRKGTEMKAVTSTTAPKEIINTTIQAIDQTLTMDFTLPGGDVAQAVLHGMILADRGSPGPQLGEGDSGSILVDEDNLIVGIYEGATADGKAIITPIKSALDALSGLAGFTLRPVIDNSPFPALVPPPAATADTTPAANAPRGIRNNNPGNLIYVAKFAQPGLADPPSDGHFCKFTNSQFGIRAMCNQLLIDQHTHKLNSVRKIINSWAPPEDNNDTTAYVKNVAAALGVSADDTIDLTDQAVMVKMVKAIIKQENNEQPYDDATLSAGMAAAGVA